MEAFGSLYDCVARVWYDETPQHLQERCLLHLLRLAFPLAREMINVPDILSQSESLVLSFEFYNHPFVELLCNKACTMSRLMPEWETVSAKRMYYAPLMKTLILRFVRYHYKHPERVYCIRSMCQLMADLLNRPIHLFWCIPEKRRDPADCIINPMSNDSYFLQDPVVLCCEKDNTTGLPVFVLVKNTEPSTLEDTLHFALNSQDELSFEFEDEMCPYALWFYQKGSHETDCIHPFVTGNDSVYTAACLHDPNRLYFIYPSDETRTLQLPFPLNSALYIYARLDDDSIVYVTRMVSNDIHVYFAAPEKTCSIICLLDTSEENARARIK